MRSAMHKLSIGLLLGILAACASVGEDFETPKVELPATFQHAGGTELAAAEPELAAWWTKLQDPTLDALVARAAHGSLDLREAYARLAEARALRGDVAGAEWPSIDGKAGFLRRGESKNTPLGAFVPDNGVYSVGFDASWEVDLWGRVRRSVEAADAELDASVENVRDVAVAVAAETARNYVELRAFQRRLAIARENVRLQEETLALVRGRFEAGLVGERDVAQASTNVESTRSRVPALEVGYAAAEHRLAVLVGLAPGALQAELDVERPIPVPPLALAVGVPADLLRRRADVRRAERELAAAHARIGVAEGDRYPRVTLAGELGLAAEDLGDLTDDQSGVFGIGPSLRWSLFDGGRLKARVAAAEARTEQAYVRFERAVLVALEEAENAMVAFVREQARRASLRQAAVQARRAVELSRAQYAEGLSDFQSVIDTERAVAELEDQLATSDATIATNFVALYKALGGGWEHSDHAEPPAPAAE
ncbi:MAG: efflux transporter outer membrane subunit [Planctomycetes bacterium]|nr:efflux transporter outer membrane subunit [Planctomycetota bacterium]